MALPTGVDPNYLPQAGWGVIFAPNVNSDVRYALEPLLRLRRGQSTTEHYHEFTGSTGYRDGDSAVRFLSRHGVSFSDITPERVPYYLLLVGSPTDIPYRFQQQLDVNYAVGRLHFDDVEAYRHYAINVVEFEEKGHGQKRTMAVFAPRITGDAHTSATVDELVTPMLDELHERAHGWRIAADLGSVRDEVTAARHSEWQRGDRLPVRRQPRRRTSGSASTLQVETRSRDLPGLAWPFHKICARHGAVRCEAERFVRRRGLQSLRQGPAVDDRSALELIQRGLRVVRHPAQYAAAKLVGRFAGAGTTWCAFRWDAGDHGFRRPRVRLLIPGLAAVDRYREAVSRAIRMVLTGARAGLAAQSFDEAYTEHAVALNALHEEVRYGKDIDPAELVGLWAATNDMRNVILLGDPAVRLPAAGPVTR